MIEQIIPIAYAFTREEKAVAEYLNCGRLDEDFPAAGWKHCHLLPCSPRGIDPKSKVDLIQRTFRLLNPFNHFPFPSPKRFHMPCKWKDYGEVESVIHYVSWWISQHYLDTEGKKAFREYLTLAGGILICDEPQDFDILITPKTPDKGAYKSIQSVKGTETRLYVSSDDSGSSIPRHTKCANRTEFEQLLRDWLENSDEETISNEAEYGKGDWIRVIDGASEYYLNADASREGIRTYLTLLDEHSTLPWSLVENNKGKMNKVVFGTAKTRITRFPLYLDL